MGIHVRVECVLGPWDEGRDGTEAATRIAEQITLAPGLLFRDAFRLLAARHPLVAALHPLTTPAARVSVRIVSEIGRGFTGPLGEAFGEGLADGDRVFIAQAPPAGPAGNDPTVSDAGPVHAARRVDRPCVSVGG